MLLRFYSMDETMRTKLEFETSLDALSLMVMAETREANARQRGRQWITGAVAFFVQELINSARAIKPREDIEMNAASAGMAAWLSESIYSGLSAEAFAQSDLVFTLLPTGAVTFDRPLALKAV